MEWWLFVGYRWRGRVRDRGCLFKLDVIDPDLDFSTKRLYFVLFTEKTKEIHYLNSVTTKGGLILQLPPRLNNIHNYDAYHNGRRQP